MTERRSSVKDLQTQMGQLATQITTLPQGNLPSTTEVNPKENCKAFTLKSGKKYEGPNGGQPVEEEIQDQPVPSSTEKKTTKSLAPEQETPQISIDHHKLPPKLKDPESFTIPCTIGRIEGINALCDLGASINLMPLSVFRRLQLGEVKPTTVTF
ncbi:uncharacterized protein LOC115719932 [Cannabis sativa]|uniref:uncharacterized protein LOC115719932 n=1 Tax=Cannabis sativa TaxID=3483 RepID=UPI0029CA2EE2|nr:uncharacterized protein LOC115719932 [Cannabis sativa]